MRSATFYNHTELISRRNSQAYKVGILKVYLINMNLNAQWAAGYDEEMKQISE